MARFARRPRATNRTIRGFYKRHQLLGSRFAPSSLKLTMQGFGKRGGVTLRMEKLRRKIGGSQNKGVQRKTTRLIG